MTAVLIIPLAFSNALLPGYSPRSQRSALDTLRRKGVEVHFKTRLSEVTADGVVVDDGVLIRL